MTALFPPFIVYWLQVITESPLYQRLFSFAKGGSARWASVGTFGKLPAKLHQSLLSMPSIKDEGVYTDKVFLGRSLWMDDCFPRLIGSGDDQNLITIGSIGSGKSTTVLYPNLTMYKAPIICIDPKGEHSQMTYRRRSGAQYLEEQGISGKTSKAFDGGRCYMLDPFGVNEKHGLPSNS